MTFYTAERLKMHTWTRRARIRFRKRWRRQHGGQNFCWFIAEPRYCHIPVKPGEMILFLREPLDGVGMKE
jgi:hypothetical protein